MTRLTVLDVLRMRPCEEYLRARIEELWAGRESLSPLEILDLAIPIEDRLWCVLHPNVIGERACRELACDFAERVLPIYESAYPGDARPRRAVETARRYLVGQATDNELAAAVDAEDAARAAWAAAEDAAEDAAWGASEAAAWAAARAAAEDAAWAAAEDARGAAGDAEINWQLDRTREVLSREE